MTDREKLAELFPPIEHEKKPVTNYDLFIRKTPEELAMWLSCRGCGLCPARNQCIEKPLGYCYDTLLNYLKQEANVGA